MVYYILSFIKSQVLFNYYLSIKTECRAGIIRARPKFFTLCGNATMRTQKRKRLNQAFPDLGVFTAAIYEFD